MELALPQPEVAGDDRVDLDAGDELEAGRDRPPAAADLAVAGQGVVVGQREVRTPHGGGGATRSTGSSTPSERVVCVWRSMVDGPGRPAPAVAGGGSCGGVRLAVRRSDLDEPLDPLDREGAAGRRVDVDLDGVEDDGPLPHLEPGRQGVDEARQDGPRSKPMTLQIGPGHPEVGLVGGAAREDPLVAGDDVGVRPDDDADPAVEIEPERVLLGGQLAVEVDEADRRQRLRTTRRAAGRRR